MRRRRIVAAAALALVALGALGIVGPLVAGWFLGRPWRVAAGSPPADLPIELVTIESKSGSALRAWLVAGREERGAVLVLHGLHSTKSAMVPRARLLNRAGYTVLLADLQAQGESPGKRITFGALEARDAEACLAFLRARFPTKPLGAVGISMGGAALLLARPPPPLRALVVESVFASIEEATRDRMRRFFGPPGAWASRLLTLQLPWRAGFSPDELRPIDRIASVGCPVLVIHGTSDRSTAFSQGERLFAAAVAPKEFWPVPGADHVDLCAFAPADYERRVLRFFDEWLR